MSRVVLKVTGKGRHYDDIQDTLVYRIRMVHKVGTKSSSEYEKTQLTLEGAQLPFYHDVEAGDEILLNFSPAIPKKIDQYQEDPS